MGHTTIFCNCETCQQIRARCDTRSLELALDKFLNNTLYKNHADQEINRVVEVDWSSSEPFDQAVKHDDGKPRFDLVPPHALQQLVDVYTAGAVKYGDRNWERGLDWGRVYAAIQRHQWAWWGGEENDPEDGISHMAHAAWGCFALMEYSRRRRYQKLDSRPKHTETTKTVEENVNENETD